MFRRVRWKAFTGQAGAHLTIFFFYSEVHNGLVMAATNIQLVYELSMKVCLFYGSISFSIRSKARDQVTQKQKKGILFEYTLVDES